MSKNSIVWSGRPAAGGGGGSAWQRAGAAEARGTGLGSEATALPLGTGVETPATGGGVTRGAHERSAVHASVAASAARSVEREGGWRITVNVGG